MPNNDTTSVQAEMLQAKAQALYQTLNKEVIVVTKGDQHIKVKPSYAYELSIKDDKEALSTDFDLIARKVDSDLEVLLENDTKVIFDNYFDLCATDLSCLVSLPSEEGMYYIVEGNFVTLADGSQIVHFYGDETALSAIAENQSGSFVQSFSDVFLADDDTSAFAYLLPFLALGGGGGGSTGDGGTGNDIFHYNMHQTSNDIITDFQVGEDTINIDGLFIFIFLGVFDVIDNGTDTTINIDTNLDYVYEPNLTITLKNVSGYDLQGMMDNNIIDYFSL